jgi:hypothetical protein
MIASAGGAGDAELGLERLGSRSSGEGRSPPTCHSGEVSEKTFGVSLVSEDSTDVFFKYRGERLPEEGDVIDVVRFIRGRPVRARVTSVDANLTPPIAATTI